MEELFTTTDIIQQEENDVESLQFGYLQALLKKLKTSCNDIELIKIDNLLNKIYKSYGQLRQGNKSTSRKLNFALSQLSTSISNQALEKQLNIQHVQKKNDIMFKLRQSIDSNLKLISQNQTLYDTISKYQQINTALTENIQILNQSLIKQKQLFNLQLQQFIQKFEAEKNNKNNSNQDISDLTNEIDTLMNENIEVRKTLSQMNSQIQLMQVLKSEIKILSYFILSSNHDQSSIKQTIVENLIKLHPYLHDIQVNDVNLELKKIFPNQQLYLSITNPNQTQQ